MHSFSITNIANTHTHQYTDTGEEVYLPDIQILPGKVEFSYLPINFQSVAIIPLSGSDGAGGAKPRGALVIGTNQAKVMRVPDLNKIRATTKLMTQMIGAE